MMLRCYRRFAMWKTLAVAVLSLGCSGVQMASPTMPESVASETGTMAAQGRCSATWLTISDVDVGRWAVLMWVAGHGQENAVLDAAILNGKATRIAFKHSTQPEGEFLLLRVNGTATVEAKVTRPWVPDCAALIISFPFDHED